MTTGSTLVDLLCSAAHEAPDQVIVQVAADGSERALTYRELLGRSLRWAGGYRAAGLGVGSPVLLLAEDPEDFLPGFWGALLAGLVPVPLAPATDRVLAVWSHLGHPPVVVPDQFASLLRTALTDVGRADRVRLLAPSSLCSAVPVAAVHAPAPGSLAFLQFSSGSTAAAKGVELSHANIVANIEQTRRAGAATGSDVVVSWLPYFHDMGLIGAHLAPLALGMKQVKLAPQDFARRPALWFEAATRHRATLLPMASFALALTLKRVPAEQATGWDLSSVRMVGVGAEPIPVTVWRRFLELLGPAGLVPSALVPLYGLAEATLAVAFPPLGEVARPHVLDRVALSQGRAVDVVPDAAGGGGGADAAEFMDVGHAVPGGELRVVDDHGGVLADSLVGNVEFRGANVASRYHGRPQESAESFVDGWLRTGDVGFLRNGRLCVTGRSKDVLFVHGQKYQAHDIEQVVAAVPGVAPGRVAVIGWADPGAGAERVVVFVPSQGRRLGELTAVVTAVRARVREALAYDDVRVLPVSPQDLPRTTSGKLQRARLRDLYATGAFAALEEEVAQAHADAASQAATASPTRAQPPRHTVEQQVTAIWARVLGVPASTIGREDRFLAIGGTSLAAMQVLAELEQEFGGPLQPAVLRHSATVAALAEHLLDRTAPGVPGSDDGPLPQGQSPEREPDSAARDRERDSAARDRERDSPARDRTVAVIALACRLPDADSPEQFWDNLVAGRDSVTEVPASRWQTPPGATARWGAFLDDVSGFDAGYFGIEADEAAAMDPHARIFLEVAHEALERAGYAGTRRRGLRVGVFVAVGENGYAQLLQRGLDRGDPVPAGALVGNLRNLVAARVAHCLDLTGPVLAVDTACSSALVALHLARRSLETGECDVAVVGGVSLNLTSTPYRLLEAAQALSPTGRCRAFASGADGFVPGEGAAAVVLEPLALARTAGDRVLAVLRGSAVNNDGRALSLLAPNPLLQEAVIADAYRDAGVDPATVGYVEAHGTGTSIGDPIEARSLLRTFPSRTQDRPRWLGSVKTNVGHLLNAAGMPSLLKVVLSLQHRTLPPSLHYGGPSPQFDLASAGFQVVTELQDWTADGPLRAGINGFGFGGTNVHVILEEAAEQDRRTPVPTGGPTAALLTVSAASDPALRAAAADLAAHLRARPGADEGDVARSAGTARDDGPHRLAVVSTGDLAARLEAAAARPTVGTRARRRPRLVLLCAGQGSQTVGMGRRLHSGEPVYRRQMEELGEAVGDVCGRTLVQWSLDADVDPADLAQTAVAQPLLVAFQIAVGRQLRAWGVRADAVLGHSVGELAAAALCGALAPAEAVGFAAERGRLMQALCEPGAMAAVRGPEAEVLAVLAAAPGLSLAALNGPNDAVVSGPADSVAAAVMALRGRGCRVRRLEVSHAFHSAMMSPASAALREAAGALTPGPHHTPLLSTVTGEWTPTFDAAYLDDHARRTVLFAPAVQRLLDEGYDTFLELGPDRMLGSLVRSLIRGAAGDRDVAVLSCSEGTTPSLLHPVGRLWERGVPVSRPPETPPRTRVEVPTYPFQRQRYWLPEPPDPTTPVAGTSHRPLSPLLHRFRWQETPLPAGRVVTSVALVGPDSGLLTALSGRLTRRGVRVHRPPPGELAAGPPASVVVLVVGPATDVEDVESLDAVARQAVTSVLEVARHLADRPAPLIVVTEDVALTGTAPERVRPGQAIAAGLAASLPDEGREQAVRIVDLSCLDDDQERLEGLVREVDAPPASGLATSVAWRRGRRLACSPDWAQVLVPDRLCPLSDDGRYLVTGGGGGIGAEVARSLAARGPCELVLVGRSPSGPSDLLAELRGRGARARYVSADLGVAAHVDALVAGLPPVSAVFHAAGLVQPGRLATRTVLDVETVLAPKVRGTYLLSRALDRAGRRPATYVAFSSIASAVPGQAGGLASYAAANAFLDAFAQAEAQAGRPLQVLSFAPWTETGMTASPAFRSTAAARGTPQVTPAEALRALYDATTLEEPRLLVAPPRGGDLPDTAAPPRGGELSDTADRTGPVQPPSEAADAPVHAVVAGLVAAELGLRPEDLDEDASLLTLGLDSLAAVDLVKRLETALGRALPTTLLFEHPSIRQVTQHLAATAATTLATPVTGCLEVPSSGQGGDSFPLTPVQLAFHTSGRLHPGIAAYTSLRQTVTGPLDEDLLARALGVLERRHGLLRLRIRLEDGLPRQRVVPPGEAGRPLWFAVRDVDHDRGIDSLEDELCNQAFALDQEAPVRAVLCRQGQGRAHLVLVLHHAAADGASLHVLAHDLWTVYTALARGREPGLRALSSSFADHANSVQRLRTTTAFEDDLRYWEARIAGRVGSLPATLPSDGDPDCPPSGPLRARQLTLGAALTAALQTRAAALDVSLFHLVLGAYARCLARWTGRAEVTVDVARAGRQARLPDIDALVGPFADTLPVTLEVRDRDAAVVARAVRVAWLDCERHGRVSSLDIARLLPTVGAAPRTAGTAGFSFARFPLDPVPDCPVAVTATAARSASAATRLGLVCWRFQDALQLSWNHPAGLFTDHTLQRFTDELLAEFAAAAGGDLALGGGPAVADPAAAEAADPVARRIGDQCRRTPDAVAVEADGFPLTYADLDRSARRLAARLRRHGVGRGDTVALLTAPGPATVVGLLGILHAGAAWVPLDATHPGPRLVDQAERTRVAAVVCHGPTRAAGERLGTTVLLDLDQVGEESLPEDPQVCDTRPGDIAYVIFTSGTTGRPKAVPVTHQAMTAYLDWAIDTFGYHGADRLTATASVCFDASVRQLLAPLLVGATVVVIPPEQLRDPEELLATVQRTRVTVWSSVPTLWAQLLRAAERHTARTGRAPDLAALRWVHVGGEPLAPAQVRRWFALLGPGQRVVNLYGPTEATINAAYDVIDARPREGLARLPIGRPLPHTRAEVVDPAGLSCPPGRPGELYLAGPALTPGYLGEPDLDTRAFVERGGIRWYRTGDRVVLLPDGRLDLLGRTDRQVKIRGHRVEPEEVEAVLAAHPGVDRAVVVAAPVPGRPGTVLTAWVRAARPAEPGHPVVGSAELRHHLAECLPAYLVPARLHLVEELPLTAMVTSDPAVLQLPRTAAGDLPADRVGTAPRPGTETLLAAVWGELLGVHPVRREDDFFVLGGDSIAVLEVFARLEGRVATLPAPTALYRHRTLAALAAAIDSAPPRPSDRGPVPRDEADLEAFALTPAQRGFLLVEALSPEARSSWVACLRVTGPLEPGLFQRAVDRLVDRHLMLRVAVEADQRPPVQRPVRAPWRVPVHHDVIEAAQLPGLVAAEQAHRFALGDWPLMRLHLLTMGAQEHALIVHGHHLIGDGYSVVVLAQDLLALYDGLASGRPDDLPPLRSTFRDYVSVLEASASAVPDGRRVSPAGPDRPYHPPRLRPPGTAAAAGAAATSPRGRAVTGTADLLLDRGTTSTLRQAAHAAGTTPYVPLLVSYHRALARLTAQHDLLVGVASTGRDHALPDITRVVGPYAHVLPVRLRDSSGSRDQVLRQVAAAVTAARASGGPPMLGGSPAGSMGAGSAFPLSGAQFLFSYLDFDALGPMSGATLTLDWDDGDTDLDPPALGTDVLMTVRPVRGGLQVRLRAPRSALSPEALHAFAADLRGEIEQIARSARPVPAAGGRPERLDAALVGYLPAPRDVARLAGIPVTDGLRELIRGRLFADGEPRLLEELTTPWGRSGFVCLPVFADELGAGGAGGLAARTARAVNLATDLGAANVSLAGLIPARTAYGFDVVRALGPQSAQVTTGHGATAASVVRTTLATLRRTGRDLADVAVACVGLGSIGRSSLELLLEVGTGAPRRLVLCDLGARSRHLAACAEQLRAGGYRGDITVAPAQPVLPDEVYAVDLVIAAVSADRPLLDVGRLRPGTVVVDDSFPHCVDTGAAIRRMQRHADVLVVGGGLLACGPSTRLPAAALLEVAGTEAVLGLRVPGTVASCQLESLLQVGRPRLPVVRGPVDVPLALAYWAALDEHDVDAAPLHLLQHVLDPCTLDRFCRH